MPKEEAWLRKVLNDAKECYNKRLNWAKDMRYTTTDVDGQNKVFVPFPDNNPYLTAVNGAWINPEKETVEWNWCGSKCVGYTIKPINNVDNRGQKS